jgi:hypothetical protein
VRSFYGNIGRFEFFVQIGWAARTGRPLRRVRFGSRRRTEEIRDYLLARLGKELGFLEQ